MPHQVLDSSQLGITHWSDRERCRFRGQACRSNWLSSLAIVLFAVLCIIVVSGAQRRSNGDFAKARDLVVAGKYDEAVTALTQFLEAHPQSQSRSRTGLFLFKAHLAKGELDKATQWCQWTIREHPRSLEAHKCQYKLGLLAMLQGKTDDAARRFGRLADRPDRPLAAEAVAMRGFLQDYRVERLVR